MSKPQPKSSPPVILLTPVIECNLPSCSDVYKGPSATAFTLGWRAIRETHDREPAPNELRAFQTGRTHLGFCPSCAKRFSVE